MASLWWIVLDGQLQHHCQSRRLLGFYIGTILFKFFIFNVENLHTCAVLNNHTSPLMKILMKMFL